MVYSWQMPESDLSGPRQLTSVRPPLWKILLAGLYDWVALVGIFFVAALPWALVSPDGHVAAGSLAFQLYLLVIINAYFCLSWWRGGQTLGMRPWRMTIVNADGSKPTLASLQVRFWVAVASVGAAGMGMLWALGGRGTWHDLASKTHPITRKRS